MSVGGVLLAAGSSRRLGRPKQQIVLGGETLLQRAVRTALEADLHPLIAVVRDAQCAQYVERLGAVPLLNAEAAEGMASSVRLGIRALPDGLLGAVILTCDQPLMRSEHLRSLYADPARMMGSSYGGRNGVPAYFPVGAFASLSALQGDTGARALLRDASAIADEDLALDVDTEDDLLHAQQRLTLMKS